MDHLQFYTDLVSKSLEMFMIPRLINNIEQSFNPQVIWINDHASSSQYKNLEKVIFLGLYPANRYPYILNYAANTENTELNFEITTVWGILRDWITKERSSMSHSLIDDKITGNYIMHFNKKHELVYINNYEKTELSPFFTFPSDVTKPQELNLEKILRHPMMWQNIKTILSDLLKEGLSDYEINQPNILIRLITSDSGAFKGLTLVFRSSLMETVKTKNAYNDFEYAVKPLKRNDELKTNNQQHNDTQSVFSGRDSIFSGMKLKPNKNKSSKGPPQLSRFGSNIQGNNGTLGVKNPGEGSKDESSDDDDDVEKNIEIKIPARRVHRNSLKRQITHGREERINTIDDANESRVKIRQIEERVGNSIIMEYMNLSHEESEKGSHHNKSETRRGSILGAGFLINYQPNNQLDVELEQRVEAKRKSKLV